MEADGTNFTFLIKSFEPDTDVKWLNENLSGKRLLLISDIRGMNFADDGVSFDKARDQDIQMQAIQGLQPEHSLLKFTVPDNCGAFYEYLPGTILKQTFCYYGTTELRLLVNGAPKELVRYNVCELFRKTEFHHENRRGQVYMASWRPVRRCLDGCFDCTVLPDTVLLYASRNDRDPSDVLDWLVKHHVYSPWEDSENACQRDLAYFLAKGRLMEAVAVLEHKTGADRVDVRELTKDVAPDQPFLAQRIKLDLPRLASKSDLARLVGSLGAPFTLLKTELNGLLQYA